MIPGLHEKTAYRYKFMWEEKRLSLFIPEIARMPPMERHFPSFGTWMFQFPLRCFAINEQRRTYSDKDMLVRSLIMLSSTAGCLLTGAGQAAETHASLQSPDGRLSWRLHAGSQAAHSLKKGGKTILEPSGLGIVVNGKTSPEASRDGMWKK